MNNFVAQLLNAAIRLGLTELQKKTVKHSKPKAGSAGREQGSANKVQEPKAKDEPSKD